MERVHAALEGEDNVSNGHHKGQRIVRCGWCTEPFLQRTWFDDFKPCCGACDRSRAAEKHRKMAVVADKASVRLRLSQRRGLAQAKKLAEKRGEVLPIVEWSSPRAERLEDDVSE